MEEFVSIVVPYFNRIDYLKELIDSAHKYADMPFELIIHDDASVDGSTPLLFEMLKNQPETITSLILNTGHNVGISKATNRLVNMASSEHIIFLNCDCSFVSKCFIDITNILKRPYIGCIHISNSIPGTETNNNLEPPNVININETESKFCLTGLQSGSALAFRKSTWKEIGGFNENVHSGASDTTFIHTLFKNGYFVCTPYAKRYVSNLSYERMQNRDSSMAMSGYDCSYPNIFNLPHNVGYDQQCKTREHQCNQYANSIRGDPESITNQGYWCNYINKLLYSVPNNTTKNIIETIDWKTASKHGQIKWKNEMSKDVYKIKI